MVTTGSVQVEKKVDPNSSIADESIEVEDIRRLAKETDHALCPVEVAARIIGQKWTLQIVNAMIDGKSMRFCEIQEHLGGMNPTTLSNRLKLLEESGLVRRTQVSNIPPHVDYSLTEMGIQLSDVIASIACWSRRWLCSCE